MAEICEICCKEKGALETDNEIFTLNCKHPFCKVCLSKYVLSHLNEYGMVAISCPTSLCGYRITEEEIDKFMMPSLRQGYISQRNTIIVANDPSKKICPNINCGKVAKKGTNCWECECGYKFCFKCCAKYDDQHSCKQNIKELRKNYGNNSTDKPVMNCLKCKIVVTKEHGCNHMTCPYCKYEWCFLCGSKYTSSHYTGIFACASHFKEFPYHIFLLLNYIALFLFPLSFLAVAMFATIYIISFAFKKCVKNKSKCTKVWFLIAMSFCGLVMFAVGYPFIILPGIVIQIMRLAVFTKRYINKKKMFV